MTNLDDDELRNALRGVDPATHQPNLDDARIRQYVAAVERDEPIPTPRRHRRRPRRRVFLLSGAATSLAAAVAGIALVSALSIPAVQDPPPMMQGAPQSCGALSIDELRSNDIAFAGRVINITDDTVTLTVTKTYMGTPDSTITVPQISDDTRDDGHNLFSVGHRYLVALTNGDVADCGQSGPDTPQLDHLYEAAFVGDATPSPGR